MTHGEMDELYELYALGVLEPELAAEIESHLEEQCAYCNEHLAAAVALDAQLATIAEPVNPPARLRRRVLAAIRPAPEPVRTWSFAPFVWAAACLALLAFAITSRLTMSNLQQRLTTLAEERDQLRSAVQVLSRPDTRTVEFGATENVPHGRVLVTRNGGVVFVGSQLPQIASNQTFELWLIPAAGAPQPAGLFRAGASGESVDVSPIHAGASTKAVAVTIEPRQGSIAPTTKPFLVVPLA
jgi:anti-sigma-K factor RskA